MQRVITTISDDIDGTEGASTVPFGLDGAVYEIDLCEANRTAFLSVISQWTSHARKVRLGASPRAGRRTRTVGGHSRSQAIRAWAATRPDIKMASRGRIPAEVEDRYHLEVERGSQTAGNGSNPGRVPFLPPDAGNGQATRAASRSGPLVPTGPKPTPREWAAATGREVKPAGRLSDALMEDYRAAMTVLGYT